MRPGHGGAVHSGHATPGPGLFAAQGEAVLNNFSFAVSRCLARCPKRHSDSAFCFAGASASDPLARIVGLGREARRCLMPLVPPARHILNQL